MDLTIVVTTEKVETEVLEVLGGLVAKEAKDLMELLKSCINLTEL